MLKMSKNKLGLEGGNKLLEMLRINNKLIGRVRKEFVW